MKFLIALVAAVMLVAFITRAPKVRRFLHVVLGILVVYAVLKMTGVIEMIAPSRDGVF